MIKHPENILIIRLSSIGDVLLATPLIRALKDAYPEANLDFVVKLKHVDILRLNPKVRKLYALDTTRGFIALKELRAELYERSYDWVVDIHNNFRSVYLRKIGASHIFKVKKYKWKRFLLVKFGINRYSRVVPVYQRYINSVDDSDVTYDDKGLDFYYDEAVYQHIHDTLIAAGLDTEKPTVCLAPGASFLVKRWPVEKYAELARMLVNHHHMQLLLVGDDKDALLTQTINEAVGAKGIDVAGRLDLMQTACGMDHADIVVTNDTGLMHLATALKKPTVALFGPTVKELGFFPVGEKSIVVENHDVPCRPCTHMGRHTCPKKHFRCMREIKVNTVLKAIQALR